MAFGNIRKWKIRAILYWADRMGLLVAAEMANAYLFNEDAVARMTREWIEVVSRDYNHPSIIIWTPVNESWGVPNLSDPRQQAHLKALYYLTKSLDNTRLVIDNDGWEHTEVTDLFAIHDYTRTGKEFRASLPERDAGAAFTALWKAVSGARASATMDRPFCFGSSAASVMFFRKTLTRSRKIRGVTPAWRPDRRVRPGTDTRTLRSYRRASRRLRHLLHAALRRGAGGQRPDDL